MSDNEGPGAEDEAAKTDDFSGKRIIPRVVEMFEQGRGNDRPGVRGSLWAAYNAVTEYLAYGRGKAADARLNSLWFGNGADLNRQALAVALRMAADLEAEVDAEETPAHPPARQPEAPAADDGDIA